MNIKRQMQRYLRITLSHHFSFKLAQLAFIFDSLRNVLVHYRSRLLLETSEQGASRRPTSDEAKEFQTISKTKTKFSK